MVACGWRRQSAGHRPGSNGAQLRRRRGRPIGQSVLPFAGWRGSGSGRGWPTRRLRARRRQRGVGAVYRETYMFLNRVEHMLQSLACLYFFANRLVVSMGAALKASIVSLNVCCIRHLGVWAERVRDDALLGGIVGSGSQCDRVSLVRDMLISCCATLGTNI